MVDRVLEHPGDRTVVFGGDEQQAMGSGDFALQPLDGLGRARIVVLVVERQVADLYQLEREVRRRQFFDGVGQLAVERIFAKAADDNGDLVLTHGDLLVKVTVEYRAYHTCANNRFFGVKKGFRKGGEEIPKGWGWQRTEPDPSLPPPPPGDALTRGADHMILIPFDLDQKGRG